MEVTQKLLHELFEYKNGNFYRKVAKAYNTKVGDLVGWLDGKGYLCVRINRKAYLVHRLIFLYHKGYLPKVLDHIDNNPLNNKIENLREASMVQNQQNVSLRKDNTSGSKNVFFRKDTKKWTVMLTINKIKKCFGCYADLELAKLVAEEARLKYHGDFANHG